MPRLSLTCLLIISLLSLSRARFQPQSDVVESQPSFLPQSQTQFQTSSLPQFPNPQNDDDDDDDRHNQITQLPTVLPQDKPDVTDTDTVQYIVVPVHRFRHVRNFDNLQDIGFSLRLPMRHGHRHHHRRFGGFGHRFRHGMMRGFEEMEDAEGRKVEMPEIPQPLHMKENMEMDTNAWNYDFTQMPMEDEEKMERVKEFMKKMRKCKHHHMEKGMMHGHHEHHHGPREEPREEQKEAGEEGGFTKQLLNLFNF